MDAVSSRPALSHPDRAAAASSLFVQFRAAQRADIIPLERFQREWNHPDPVIASALRASQ
jgi:hypothetical protein